MTDMATKSRSRKAATSTALVVPKKKVRKPRAKQVDLEVVDDGDPMQAVYEGVHLIGKAVQAVGAVVDFLTPHIERMSNKRK